MYRTDPTPAALPCPGLRADGLMLRYPRQGGPAALDDVTVDLTPGDSLAVTGPSGSGKTSLLLVLAGILRPNRGSVHWRDRDLTRLSDRERTRLRRTEFGFVFQSGQLLAELPAVENVALPLMLGGTGRREAFTRAEQQLSHLGLAGLAGRRPGQLSGGQAQRVAVARALVTRPGVVFADEPTGALDHASGQAVMHALTTVCRATGSSLVVVTHDEAVSRWCTRTVGMFDGRLVAAHSVSVA